MTLLAVVGWFAVIVLIAPRIGRRLKATWLPDPREPTHADPGCPSPGSAFDVKWPWCPWVQYERGSDWRPLLELFNQRDRP
jgi:hypothetical protein